MSQCTAPNLAEPVPRTSSKPELGEILVFTDNRSEAASILEFAGLLAEENGARLISVFTRTSHASLHFIDVKSRTSAVVHAMIRCEQPECGGQRTRQISL
jgi:hypothetical protein